MNPVLNGNLNLRVSQSNQEFTHITLTDLTGKVILVQQNNGLNNLNINVADLSNGMYLLQVSNNNSILKVEKITIANQ